MKYITLENLPVNSLRRQPLAVEIGGEVKSYVLYGDIAVTEKGELFKLGEKVCRKGEHKLTETYKAFQKALAEPLLSVYHNWLTVHEMLPYEEELEANPPCEDWWNCNDELDKIIWLVCSTIS